jgi:acyl-coenzyme A thioesterase PaaI-like protein
LSLTDAAAVVTDPVGAWFGAVVHRTGPDTCAVTIPEPAPGTGGSVLARMGQGADIAAGVSANLAVAPRSALTADLVLHVLRDDAVGALTFRGSIARAGRAQAVAVIEVQDERGLLVGAATANHGIRDDELRMYLHDLEPGDSFDLGFYRTTPLGPLAEVFHADGEIPVDARTSNPWGIGQGALMATLVEPAAAAAGLARIEDLTIRFIASATVGPVRFVPTTVSDRPGNRLLTGALHDRGADRTVSLISAAGPAEGTLR